MMHWKRTAALSALLVILSATAAGASELAIPTSAPANPGVEIPISAPAEEAPAAMRLAGRLTYVDLEGGFYAVNGVRLIGNAAEFEAYLNREVVVTGRPFTGVSFQMVPAIHVEMLQLAQDAAVLTPVSAHSPLPRVIRVNGKEIEQDPGPVVQDGILLVPLRAIAEAAGGQVTWNDAQQRIAIRMPDRSISVAVGDSKAEINEDGVYYFTRNLTAMAAAPVLVGGRTMISAEALTTVMGLMQEEAEEGVLSLVSEKQRRPLEEDPADAQNRLVGTIREVSDGERLRILLEGEPMSNGEPRLIWLSVTDKTRITVGEAAGTSADLAVGQTVEVELSGPILESYPAQGGANAIRIKK